MKLPALMIATLISSVCFAFDCYPDSDNPYVWHVRADGNDSNEGHSYQTGLATIQAAVNAASNGDSIFIWPGIYTEEVNNTKVLNIYGAHKSATKITSSTGCPLTLKTGSDGSYVKGISLYSSSADFNGKGLYAAYIKNFTIEDCTAAAPFDAIYVVGSSNFRIYKSNFIGHYDGGNFSNASNFIARDCFFEADGTYGTGSPSRSLYASGARGTFENCSFTAVRDDSSSQTLAGISTFGGSHGANLIFSKCNFYAYNGLSDTGICAGAEIARAGDLVNFSECIFSVPGQKGSIYGVYNNGGRVVLTNSSLYANGISPTERFYVKNLSGSIVINGCFYSTSTTNGVSGTITQMDSGWSSAVASIVDANSKPSTILTAISGNDSNNETRWSSALAAISAADANIADKIQNINGVTDVNSLNDNLNEMRSDINYIREQTRRVWFALQKLFLVLLGR